MIVFPMAGLSSRFTRAGYNRPKWMLLLAGRPLFDWSLMGFRENLEHETCVIIHLESPDVSTFVRERTRTLGIRNVEFVSLAAPTRGQADTVATGLARIGAPADEALTIFNVDTIRPDYRPAPILDTCDGWLECFEGQGDHWSFARPLAAGSDRVVEVTEKVRVSPYCSTGLYWFRSAGLFMDAFADGQGELSAGELYVAPLYQKLIADGRDVRFGVIQPEDIFFSGTPDEYQHTLKLEAELKARFGE
ncbi:glycosyltransferase family 2 protein [soil metagenome]